MPRRDEENYDSSLDLEDGDGDMPSQARLTIIRSCKGSTFCIIISVIGLVIAMNAMFAFIDYVYSLNIPVISYLFSPELRESAFGLVVFSLTFTACMLGVLLIIAAVLSLYEAIVNMVRYW